MRADETFSQAQDLAAKLLYGNIGRREFLKRAAAAGFSTTTIATILAACGGAPEATPTTAAPQSTATLVPTARPVVPVQSSAVAAASATPASATPAASATVAPTAAATTASAVAGGKLVIGVGTEPTGLDPNGLSGVDAYTLDMHMFDSLLAMDTNFNIYPWLATAWKLSDDQKSFTFTLRKDVKFHDGTPFNAAAVKFTFDRIRDPAVKSTSAIGILGNFYTGTDVVDDYTAVVNFSQPYAPFLGGVTTSFLGIVSPTAVQKSGADFPLKPVGSGPYIFKEWIQKQSCTVVRNPDYKWPSDLFKNKGAGYLDEITFRFVPESATRQALLDTGEAQAITAVPTQNVATIKGKGTQQMLIALRTGGPKMVDLNCKKAPLDQLEVRQALHHAFNRQELVTGLLQGVFPVAGAPLSPSTFGYDKTVEGMYPPDPAKAAQLLDKAGWVMGSSGLREKGGQQFKLNCLIGTSEEDAAIAQILQGQLKPLGIQVDINVIAGTALTTAKREGQHHIGFKIGVYQDPDILGLYFHSRSLGGFNYTFYVDKNLDSLLDAGVTTFDPEKRKAVYAQVQKLMMEQAILIPIYYLSNLWGASNKLQGVFGDTAGYFWLHDATLQR